MARPPRMIVSGSNRFSIATTAARNSGATSAIQPSSPISGSRRSQRFERQIALEAAAIAAGTGFAAGQHGQMADLAGIAMGAAQRAARHGPSCRRGRRRNRDSRNRASCGPRRRAARRAPPRRRRHPMKAGRSGRLRQALAHRERPSSPASVVGPTKLMTSTSKGPGIAMPSAQDAVLRLERLRAPAASSAISAKARSGAAWAIRDCMRCDDVAGEIDQRRVDAASASR